LKRDYEFKELKRPQDVLPDPKDTSVASQKPRMPKYPILLPHHYQNAKQQHVPAVSLIINNNKHADNNTNNNNTNNNNSNNNKHESLYDDDTLQAKHGAPSPPRTETETAQTSHHEHLDRCMD
jgi:hypothetical protein